MGWIILYSKMLNTRKRRKKTKTGKGYVQFILDEAGKEVSPRVVKGVDASLNQEALRVISLLPD